MWIFSCRVSRPFQVLFTGRTVKDVSIRDVPREVLPNMQTCDRMSRSYPVYVSCIVIMFGRWENHSICRSFRMMQGYSRPRSDGRLNCVQVLQDSSEHIRYITNIIIHLQLSRMWAVSNRFILYWFLFYTELNFGSHLNVIKIGNTELCLRLFALY